MKHVKVDATTSTNETAKLLRKNGFADNFCISAEYQTQGKGQHRKSWVSEKSKNLTFTVVLGNLNLLVEQRFYLNIVVCNALLNVLKTYNLENLQIKWPNDILAGQRKICGILIENTLTRNKITTTFIGIGLNVNQVSFQDLPQASSLKLLLNKEFERDEILNNLIEKLEDIPDYLNSNSFEHALQRYKNDLYGYNTNTLFNLNQTKVSGKILDIEVSGALKIGFEDGVVKKYNHSEIQQLY